MPQSLQKGDRAKIIALKNTAALFKELQSICDDFKDTPDATFDLQWLQHLTKDIQGVAEQLKAVGKAWEAARTTISTDPVVAQIVQNLYGD